MSKITGNEPYYAKSAFYHESGGVDSPQQGITIRQQFAMAAMQGIVSAMACRTDTTVEEDVELARKYADALINELNKSEQ